MENMEHLLVVSKLNDIGDFYQQVKAKLVDGWIPFGGVKVLLDNEGWKTYHQIMSRPSQAGGAINPSTRPSITMLDKDYIVLANNYEGPPDYWNTSMNNLANKGYALQGEMEIVMEHVTFPLYFQAMYKPG